VLRQSIDLFNRRGYEATSISDLAKELGISKSGIFHHFDTKESMLAAALDEALDGLTRAVSAGTQNGDGASSYDRLKATVQASVQILVEHLPAVTLLQRVRCNSPLEQQALERRRDIDDQLAALVRNAVDEGTIRSDIEPDLITRLIFGMVNSLIEWYRPNGKIDQGVLAIAITDVLFDGLSNDRT
jgi:AcrR family transcriptional regulator